jgi:hypothetical protein
MLSYGPQEVTRVIAAKAGREDDGCEFTTGMAEKP